MAWVLVLRGRLLLGLLFFSSKNVFNVFNATICRSPFSVPVSGVRCPVLCHHVVLDLFPCFSSLVPGLYPDVSPFKIPKIDPQLSFFVSRC